MPVTTPEVRIPCERCRVEDIRSEMHELEGDLYCDNCYDHIVDECPHCDENCNSEHMRIMEGRDLRICSHCAEDNDITNACERCGDLCFIEDLLEELCQVCRDREEDTRRSTADTETNELQSKAEGKIIKSKRKFGVELECVYALTTSNRELASKLHPSWGFSDDGSIRPSKNSIGTRELVSTVMKGKAGEDEIVKLGLYANKVGFHVNSSCGFHLHLDSPEFKRNEKEDTREHNDNFPSHSEYVVRDRRGKVLNKFQQIPEPRDIQMMRDSGYTLEERSVGGLVVNRGENFQRLRDLFYVYLAFDDIFRSMQPPSRRNNRFCHSTSSVYSLSEIRELDDFGELERLWYKVDKRRRLEDQMRSVDSAKRHKDGSRYVGFNLEPLLREGSRNIEFRYHSPTLNAEKILRWVDIHQSIMDRVASGPIDEQSINEVCARDTHLIKKAQAMCQMFGIRKETQEYIISRLHKFNKINASNSQLEDEEVEPSEIGTPSHRNGTPLMQRSPQSSQVWRASPSIAQINPYFEMRSNSSISSRITHMGIENLSLDEAQASTNTLNSANVVRAVAQLRTNDLDVRSYDDVLRDNENNN